ncbi:MAG TPA: family 43 glycosylhydrolase, partial [Lachnospiraceae bacterium]|nr:family 43 glycosylhydrolase [Lachnospiraceae bacterium]
MHKKYTTCFKSAAMVIATVLLVSTTGCNKATDSKDNPSTSKVEENSENADSKPDTNDTKTVTDTSESSAATQKLKKSTYSSLAAVHDPSIIKDGDTYYIFGSHMEAAKSSDLWTWDSFATGVNSNNKLFNGLFKSAAFDWVGLNDQGGYSVWAPDVIYNEKMGKYCMYFCTTSDWNTSTLCLATSDKIEG